MTVKLLAAWGGQPPGTLFTSDAATEAAMVAGKQATTDLSNAVSWNTPAPSTVPAPGYYLGAVAGGCRIPNAYSGGNSAYSNTRSPHVQRDSKPLKVSFPNFYVDDTGGANQNKEVATDAPFTCTASLEYPAGVYTQFTWGGATSTVAPAGGKTPDSDPMPPPPIGARFWICCYRAGVSGAPYTLDNVANDVANGAAFNYLNTFLPDLTMGGTITNTNSAVMCHPLSIVGQTALPTVVYLGDSRIIGVLDTFGSNIPYTGELDRTIGPRFGTINAAKQGDRVVDFLQYGTRRIALAAYATHVVINFGINDILTGRTSAQVIADLKTLWAMFPGKPVYQCTIPPGQATSTDSFATVGNQTAHATNSVRVAVNAAIRAFPASLTGYFEIADAVESARDSGKWKAPGYTTDGLHESQLANLAIKASGAIDLGVFTR